MLNRIKFLDGFRGIAVLLVVLFHLELNNFGFAGVELFFVISGFIITLLLLKEYDENKKISIKNFFIRRINRLFPALIATLALVLIVFINSPIAGIETEFFTQATWASFLSSNWYEIVHQVGYWEQGVKSPLLHMWSLSIEFQFYIFWPFLVLFLIKLSQENKRRMILLFTILFLIFTGLTIGWSYSTDFSGVYYNTFTRVSSFVAGALGSIFVHKSTKSQSTTKNFLLLISIGLLAFLTVHFTLNELSIFRGYISAYSLVFTLVLVLLAKTESRLMTILFENPLLLFFGKISYSFYLVHMPVIAFLTNVKLVSWFHLATPLPNMELRLLQFGISLVLGTLFWFLFEKLLKSKSGIIAIILLFTLPGTVRFISEQKYHFKFDHTSKTMDSKWIANTPVITEGKVPVLVIGDSWSRRTAMGLYEAQDGLEDKPFSVLSFGLGNASIMSDSYFIENDGTRTPGSFSFDSFEGYQNYWLSAAKEHHAKKVVIELGNSDQHFQNVNGRELTVGDKEFDQMYIRNYNTLIQNLRATGVEIYIMNVVNNSGDQEAVKNNMNKKSDAMNKNISEVIKGNPDVHLLDLRSLLGIGETSISTIRGYNVYDETAHTSYEGSLYIGEWLLRELDKE